MSELIGVNRVGDVYSLDSLNHLSDSLVLQKFIYKNDSCTGYFIGYNSLGIKVAKIDFMQNKNYQITIFNEKGQRKELILIINDTIEEHLKFDKKGKLFEKVRLHCNGKKISENLYYNNGNVIHSNIYNSIGELIIEKSYYKNGQLMNVYLYKNDIVIESQFFNRKGEIKK